MLLVELTISKVELDPQTFLAIMLRSSNSSNYPGYLPSANFCNYVIGKGGIGFQKFCPASWIFSRSWTDDSISDSPLQSRLWFYVQ